MAEKLEIEKPLQKWNICIAVAFDFGQNLKYFLYIYYKYGTSTLGTVTFFKRNDSFILHSTLRIFSASNIFGSCMFIICFISFYQKCSRQERHHQQRYYNDCLHTLKINGNETFILLVQSNFHVVLRCAKAHHYFVLCCYYHYN